jgi:uncharacterized protein YfdQ (DUF2303 family)
LSKSNEPDIPKRNEIQAAIAAGAAIGQARMCSMPDPLQSAPYAVVPSDYDIESLERYLPQPLRVIQNVQLDDAESFIHYLKEFGALETRCFFNAERETFVAIIDYHADAPGWCDHVVSFTAKRSEEFKTWMGANRREMSQVDFVRFLEDNMPDVAGIVRNGEIVKGSAQLLDIALRFETKKSVEYSSGVRLANGDIQFAYSEVVRTGNVENGTIEIPEQFALGISIHVNGTAYSIPVRLRWRLKEGRLSMWYEIVRPHKFIEDALRDVRAQIAEAVNIPILAGVAEL